MRPKSEFSKELHGLQYHEKHKTSLRLSHRDEAASRSSVPQPLKSKAVNPPPPLPSSRLGVASVGEDSVHRASHSPSWTARVPSLFPFVLLYFGGNRDLTVLTGGPELRVRGVISRSVHTVRHPRGSYIVSPLLSLEMDTLEKKGIIETAIRYATKYE